MAITVLTKHLAATQQQVFNWLEQNPALTAQKGLTILSNSLSLFDEIKALTKDKLRLF